MIEERIVTVTGDISTRGYRRGALLGTGGFARVYELAALDPPSSSAAKIISKEVLSKSRARQKLMNEVKIHRSLHHENILSFKHFFEDEENVYILIELCKNQTLSDKLRRRKRLTEPEVQYYLLQIIQGLTYLHSHSIVHRDLKLGNIFLNDEMKVKIGDFGLAAKIEFEGERKHTVCGTPNYIAPEVLEGAQGYSYEVDLWSLGIIAYTLSVGKPPFETNDVQQTYQRIALNAYHFPKNFGGSERLKNLISRLLMTDPRARPELSALLNHSFFAGDVPSSLPSSSLAIPPSSNFMKALSLGGTRPFRRLQSDKNPHTPTAATPPGALSNRSETGKIVAVTSKLLVAELHVKKWVDYTRKYGLAYSLSNGNTGIHFNDSSRILAVSDKNFFYIAKDRNRELDVREFFFERYPEEYRKKVNLLEMFVKRLSGGGQGAAGELVYLKKWYFAPKAAILQLSNHTLQVQFNDGTELIINSELATVSFVGKRGETLTCPYSPGSDSGNQDIDRRVKYTKETLTKLVNKPFN